MKKIALADDHVLLRKGLAGLVTDLGYSVVLESDNGQEMIEMIKTGIEPDLVLMDINMPVMDGYVTTKWLSANKHAIRVLALSMYDDESAILKMLRSGARGYILKDSEPGELRAALEAVLNKGYYYSELVTGKLIHSIHQSEEDSGSSLHKLNEREMEFLKLACSELTYKEIAAQMHLSPRTIDGYRDALFEKLEIKTRTGLAIFAIKNKIVEI